MEENKINKNIKVKKEGFLKGCLIGCLSSFLVIVLIIGVLIGGGYWFFMRLKKGEDPGSYFSMERSSLATDCGDSLECLEKSVISCEPSFGQAELEESIIFDFEVLGQRQDYCVIYFKIKELKQPFFEVNFVPEFILREMLKDSSMECLVPKKYYQKGSMETIDYALENMRSVCHGSLLNLLNKIGY